MHNTRNELFFSKADFDAVKGSSLELAERLSIVADMIRFNTLATIAYAGSGHIGTSLSAADLFTLLYHHLMRYDPQHPHKHGRDIFILSKGHASPGLYATLASAGFMEAEKLKGFRKLDGLQGHVDVSVPGIDANTGSLGMGISKGKGHAWAYKSEKNGGRAYVMVGDGELQEGQNWEALQSAGHMKLDNLYLIIDRNMVQTDRKVSEISDIEPLDRKLEDFGWDVVRTDGNDIGKLLEAFTKLETQNPKPGQEPGPKALIADTKKGRGVFFMCCDSPDAFRDGLYRWHGGFSNDEDRKRAFDELGSRLEPKLAPLGISIPTYIAPAPTPSTFKGSSLKPAFSNSLLKLAEKHKEMVVMDADLGEDCGLLPFERQHPDRFIQVGIAEQDMVSMAGGLAKAGRLPIVNTYTAFLSSRSNEQIFNNCSEKDKVIYVGHLAGLLPAKPGKSHQGIRDISLLRSIPNLTLCQPCTGAELEAIMELLADSHGSAYMRLEHVPPREDVQLPEDYEVATGKGAVLCEGKDAAIISHGAVMVSESVLASEVLEKEGISVMVIDLPWLNHIDKEWLQKALEGIKHVFCVENHSAIGGQAEEVARRISDDCSLNVIGVEGWPQSGDNGDVLGRYALDHASIAKKIKEVLGR
ncbi:MAG: transketolase C-terminal domain-containing protein [Candidatus Micrarchaeota archaeon]